LFSFFSFFLVRGFRPGFGQVLRMGGIGREGPLRALHVCVCVWIYKESTLGAAWERSVGAKGRGSFTIALHAIF
jgi:hypothetical protein